MKVGTQFFISLVCSSLIFTGCSNFFHDLIPKGEKELKSINLLSDGKNVTVSSSSYESNFSLILKSDCDITKLTPSVDIPRNASIIPVSPVYLKAAFPSADYEKTMEEYLLAKSSGNLQSFALRMIKQNPDFNVPKLDKEIDFTSPVPFLVIAADGSTATYSVSAIVRDDISNLVATGGDCKVSLTWKNPEGVDFKGVKIKCSDKSVADVYVDSASASNNSCVIRGLKNDETYTFSACVEFGKKDFGKALSVDCIPSVYPVKNAYTEGGDGFVTVIWENPGDDDIGFVEVQLDHLNYRTEMVKDLIPSEEGKCTFKGLTNGTEHTFTITVHYKSGAVSSEVTVTGTPSTDLRPGDLFIDGIVLDGKKLENTAESYIVVPNTKGEVVRKEGDHSFFSGGGTYTSEFDPFVMGRYEVTRELYYSIMEPSKVLPASEKYLPADGITFYEAIAFCNKLSMKMGLEPYYSYYGETDPDKWLKDSRLSPSLPKNTTTSKNYKNWVECCSGSGSTGSVSYRSSCSGYRLPSVYEWEYAARGGNQKAAAWKNTYGTGNTLYKSETNTNSSLTGHAWYHTTVTTNTAVAGWCDPGKRTLEEYEGDRGKEVRKDSTSYVNSAKKVGWSKANSLNLYDMVGNVSEWVNGNKLKEQWRVTNTVTNKIVEEHETADYLVKSLGGDWAMHGKGLRYKLNHQSGFETDELYHKSNFMGIHTCECIETTVSWDPKVNSFMYPSYSRPGQGLRICRYYNGE